MRALIQRVTQASVTTDGELVGEIKQGLCVFIGVTNSDTEATATRLSEKLWNVRVFEDNTGAMNVSANELNLPLLVVSQFTLYGDTRKGRRPSFIDAARPEVAEPLCDAVVDALRKLGAHVETGRFRTDMQVSIINDGPVTLMIEV